MNRNIEKYIPVALAVLADSQTGIVKFGKIEKTYNGYISSFGASIISSGLLPTVIFYSKAAGGNTEADRSLIIKALERMLKEINEGVLTANQHLLEEVITRYSEKRLNQKIQECAIALKLAIRTYPQPKKDKL